MSSTKQEPRADINDPKIVPISRLSDLSPSQQRILALLAEGHSNKKIADILIIAESTVKIHVRGIMKKLKVENRTKAAAVYLEDIRSSNQNMKVPHQKLDTITQTRHLEEEIDKSLARIEAEIFTSSSQISYLIKKLRLIDSDGV